MEFFVFSGALKRMLNFNVPPVKNSTGEPVWKVSQVINCSSIQDNWYYQINYLVIFVKNIFL